MIYVSMRFGIIRAKTRRLWHRTYICFFTDWTTIILFFLLVFVDNSTVIRGWEDLQPIGWRDRGDWWYLIGGRHFAKWWKQLLWYSHWLSMTNYVYNWSDQLVWCHDHKNRHLRVWSNFWKHFQLQILIGCWEPIRWTLVCPYFSPYGE